MNPNPIFSRERTTVINDNWLFSYDDINYQPINVPFCPQSVLSNICNTDFINKCYYKKKFYFEKKEDKVFLCFCAIDYKAIVYVNNWIVGKHIGGYTSFRFDISDYIVNGENEIFLEVSDNYSDNIASGKQSRKKNSFGCYYTRTTGIWQDVYLEEMPNDYLKEIYFKPDIDNLKVNIKGIVEGCADCNIDIFFKGKNVGNIHQTFCNEFDVNIDLSEKHLWEISRGNIYDVHISFGNDSVWSYFGLRKVEYKGYDFYLNNKKIYQKLVLNQGYNEKGIYTEPDGDFIKQDINDAFDLGFNGMRLHQKIFSPKFLYYCDITGIMVWGEFPNWGISLFDNATRNQYIHELKEMLIRDFNHPSIVCWCPFNELWNDVKLSTINFVKDTYEFIKSFDDSRICVDVSGGIHSQATDIFDFHCYENFSVLKKYLEEFDRNSMLDIPLLYGKDGVGTPYKKGLPVIISECGGMSYSNGGKVNVIPTVNDNAIESEGSWAYGSIDNDFASFIYKYENLIKTIFSSPKISGFCYTQLFDIEQEKNGFYNYDRSNKFTDEQKKIIKTINSQY